LHQTYQFSRIRLPARESREGRYRQRGITDEMSVTLGKTIS
jgi:hypothetical protein